MLALNRIFTCGFSLLFSFWTLTSGSKIVFNGSPGDVKQGLTGALTLRCSLNDTSASASVIGRRNNDVTSTFDNVEQVSSIIIMHNGVDLASVAQSHQAKVMDGSNKVMATGNVKEKTNERGFLELTYSDPGLNETGEFVCEINALNNAGHSVVFSTSLEVTLSQPTLVDLVEHIRQLENEKATMQQTIDALKNQGSSSVHSESGLVECGDSASWMGRHTLFTSQSRYTEQVIMFSNPYSETPTVSAAVAEMDDSNAHNSRFRVSVVSASPTSFTVRCETWVDSQVYRMAVSWISLP